MTYFNDTISYELSDKIPDGIYKIYVDKALTILDCTGEIKNQKKENTWTWFFEDGVKKHEITYQAGIYDGPEKYYYPNGQKSLTITFTKGKQNGLTIGWYLKGDKMFEGAYLDGNASGVWNFYNEDGTLFSKEEKQ